MVEWVLNKLELESIDFGRWHIWNKKNDAIRPLRVKKLRLNDKYSDILISQYRTSEQQKAGKLLRDEFKRRISNGKSYYVYTEAKQSQYKDTNQQLH